MNKPQDSNDGVETKGVPHITITFDPRAYQVQVGGSTPNLEFAEYLLEQALRLTRKQIADRDAPKIFGPSLVPHSSSRGV